MYIYKIPQKMSNSGSIHDIASDCYDRQIKFRGNVQYALILASYYGGKGYWTGNEQAMLRAAKRWGEYSYKIIDRDGNEYIADYDRLIKKY